MAKVDYRRFRGRNKTFTPERFKMRWGYFLTSILVAVIVGAVSGKILTIRL
ncbi:MAG: hypothetical protein Q8P92_02595 [Candidatus Daviesbacteria bacterium]|nr:hypothetical protein [Candidatus Daviesbacteria bacterium]